MADPADTQHAEKLAAELRALHDRREREPLTPEEEARYAELWAWWQRGTAEAATGARAEERSDTAPGPASAAAGRGDVPEEWLFAVTGKEAAPPREDGVAAPDLIKEWEEWQTRQARADPFELMPEDAGAAPRSEEEVLAARAEVLGTEIDTAGEPSGAYAPAPPAAVAPPPGSDVARSTPAAQSDARRVVIHLTDGQARRGQLVDADLTGPTFSYVGASGAPEAVARAQVRTLFVMRGPGAPLPAPTGDRIHVTLRDGREITGISADHASGGDAFTLVPDEARASAALVWVARAAVRTLTVRS